MIEAHYFDGESSQRHPVTLLLHRGIVAISGESVRRSLRLSQIQVSERMESAPRILRLPDGGLIEVRDAKLDRLLARNGYREPRVVRWQRNWPASLVALMSLVMLLVAGYQWGLPMAADTLAQHLPESLAANIGDQQLEMLDNAYLQPSRLDQARQTRLRETFAALRRPTETEGGYRLEFRHSQVGPNAFALPNGVIVMTDQLVLLAPHENAVLGVLAHELGHLERRHSLRRLLQALGVGVAVNLLLGDVSSVLTVGPAFLLDQKYSRDFEREADQYAVAMMRHNGLPLSPMAELFARMGQGDEEGAPHKGRGRAKEQGGVERALSYLSSHPSDAERIEQLRAADVQQ
jgi:Zn-dependent protease with chaperone function